MCGLGAATGVNISEAHISEEHIGFVPGFYRHTGLQGKRVQDNSVMPYTLFLHPNLTT
jgi:hypothetical protein